MALMIPPRVHPETPSSERKIFERLKLDLGTADWTVLHSLGLSRRRSGAYGEIDFVVLVPGEGVICLEVKGGRVRSESGIWYTRDRHGREHALSRSPFQQIRDAVFGLRDAVQSRFGPADMPSNVLYASAVVFPDIEAPPPSPEFERWEVIDRTDLRQSISIPIRQVLREEAKRSGGRMRGEAASPETLKALRNYLRPEFDVGIARLTTIRRSEERIVRLTEEQYDAIDLFERNARCLVEGAAGTGKTMLAVEFARRMASTGGEVLLLCYNRLLGEWLARTAGRIGGGRVVAGSFHGRLRRLILDSSVAEEFRTAERAAEEGGRMEDLFEVAYPLYGHLALAESDQRASILVLDEAQDLLQPSVLEVLNEWLVGGLTGGRWVILGDFTQQAIFGGPYEPRGATDVLAPYAPHHTATVLRRNCRNTHRIGEETALLSGFPGLPYRLDSEDCLPVDYRYWRNQEHQKQRLEQLLTSLRDDGVPPDDIVILSPRRYDGSVASQVSGSRVVPLSALDSTPGTIGFSTIHAFKGLESPVVIICDLDSLETNERSLFYVGMSRARSHLILLLREGLQRSVAEAVRRRLERGW